MAFDRAGVLQRIMIRELRFVGNKLLSSDFFQIENVFAVLALQTFSKELTADFQTLSTSGTMKGNEFIHAFFGCQEVFNLAGAALP